MSTVHFTGPVLQADVEMEHGDWWACEHPERPYQAGYTCFHNVACRPCLIAAEVVLNKINPLTTDPLVLESWHETIAVLAGEIESTQLEEHWADRMAREEGVA